VRGGLNIGCVGEAGMAGFAVANYESRCSTRNWHWPRIAVLPLRWSNSSLTILR
jgi:hypothetical protein